VALENTFTGMLTPLPVVEGTLLSYFQVDPRDALTYEGTENGDLSDHRSISKHRLHVTRLSSRSRS